MIALHSNVLHFHKDCMHLVDVNNNDAYLNLTIWAASEAASDNFCKADLS